MPTNDVPRWTYTEGVSDEDAPPITPHDLPPVEAEGEDG